MKIAVITDSSSNLTQAYIKSVENLYMLPLLISMDDKFYRDQIEIDSTTVYDRLPKTDVKTSLPDMGDLEGAIEKFKSEGYTDIIIITLSSKLSGTHNAIRNGIKEITGIKLHMHDTKTLSMALGYVVMEAIDLIEKKLSVKKIIEKLEILRQKDLLAMFTVETLRWLRKGGRIGKVEGTIGEILHVKPVIGLTEDGVYYTITKGFGMKRTFITMRKELKKFFGDDLIEVTLHYGNDSGYAESIKEKIMDEMNVTKVNLTQLTPVLGVHVGPGILAVIARRIYK
ncbi:DegV family protein [Mycoplasmatota bacterium WC30]